MAKSIKYYKITLNVDENDTYQNSIVDYVVADDGVTYPPHTQGERKKIGITPNASDTRTNIITSAVNSVKTVEGIS